MTQSPVLKDFCDFIEQNDIARCRRTLLLLSELEITALVNSSLDSRSPRTPMHFAASENVHLDIWKLLLPWSRDNNLCDGPLAALSVLIKHFKHIEGNKSPVRKCYVKHRQLIKIRCWLELSKQSTSTMVHHHKTQLLCDLCMLQGGRHPEEASFYEIRNLAEDMIVKYHTDVAGNLSCRPLHWALTNDQICLLFLFLSHGADPDCLDYEKSTPLLSDFMFREQQLLLPCLSLLVKHGAKLDSEHPNYAYTAFHSVLLKLTPSEFESFMKKYHDLWNTAVDNYLALPPLHGLILYALSKSPHRKNTHKIQCDIMLKARVLFAYGLQIELGDLHDRTVLHYACWFKFRLVVEYLISVGADLLKKDAFGRGCLYYAVSQLVQNYDILGGEEQLSTLKMVAEEIGDNSSIEIETNRRVHFLNCPVRPNFYIASKLQEMTDNLGRSAVHFAVFENNASALAYLLDIGFDVDICDFAGKSAVDYIDITNNECVRVIKKRCLKSRRNKPLSNEALPEFERNATTTDIFFEGRQTGYVYGADNNLADNMDDTMKYNKKSTVEGCLYLDENKLEFSTRPPLAISSGIDRVRMLLSNANCGVLKHNEALHIIKDMYKLVDKLAVGLASRDQRFHSTIELAGSVSEGTKLKPPDEFDFQFHLKSISPCFYIKQLMAGNDIRLGIGTSGDDSLIKDLVTESDTLNKALFHVFHATACKVLSGTSFWEDLPFYWRRHTLVASKNHKSVTATGKVTVPLCLKWTGPEEADMNISVDLVPVIIMTKLPRFIAKKIPYKVMRFVERSQFKWHIICRNSKHARLSFFPVERWILCRLMPELREAYALAKSVIKYCSETLDADSDRITSYMLKNALFYELDRNSKFCLLDDEIVPLQDVSSLQWLILNILRESVTKEIRSSEAFVQNWTLRIFDRLEKWFTEGDGAHIYCRPSETFPDIIIEDLDVRIIRLFKSVILDSNNR